MRCDAFQRFIESLTRRTPRRQPRRSRRYPAANVPASVERLEKRTLLSVTTIAPAADGYATDQGPDGTFDSVNTTSDNNLAWIVTGVPNAFEDRALLDFNISGIAAGNHVNSAVLNITVSQFVTPSGSPVIIDILGYARSGPLTTADATASSTQVASLTFADSVNSLTTFGIKLDTQFVQGLLGNSSDLGLIVRIDPASPGYGMGFYSTRATYVPLSERPSLVIDSTAAQPGLTVGTSVSTISENAGPGAVTGTVTRQDADLSQALTVSLASSDPGEATVPASVTIAAGQTSATFGISPVDNTILDGTHAVTISASASGFTSGSASINVTDYETLSLSLAASTIAENAGAAATTGTITRNNTNIDQPLTVTLTSSNVNQAAVPSTVTIAAGQASATFAVDAVDDIVVNGTQTVTITASATGYAGPVSSTLKVTDTDGGHIRPQDILVSTNNAGSTLALVDEYTTAGLLVQQYTAPSSEEARDLVVDQNGQIQLYNGTFSPTLTTIDPATGNASELAIPGLSTVNNVSYGGIGTFHQFVFLTDMATNGAAAQGIVRVDLTDHSWQRFATDKQFQALTVGEDGLVYALDGSGLPGYQVSVYNPVTMALVRTVNLAVNDYRGIAVNAVGDIFASGWDGSISHFDPSGNLLASVATGVTNLQALALRQDGTLVTSNWSGTVVLADVSLNPANITHFTVANRPVFAAFAASAVFPQPTVDATSGTSSYTENDPPTAVDPGLLVTTDGEQLTGATVQIGAGFQLNQDVLAFANQNGITGTYDASLGALTLSGAASASQYQAALRSITYSNTSDNPDPTPRAITFSVTDGTYTESASKTVNVIPVNDPPVITSGQSFTAAENAANGTVVGTVLATDVDSPQSALQAYTIVSGNTNNAFAINAATGQITVADGTQLDYETTSSFTLGVTVSDGKNASAVGNVVVNITDVTAPPVMANQTFSLLEKSPAGMVVGTMTASNPDADDALVFSIESGNTNNAFAINAATGQITVADSSKLNFLVQSSYSLSVRAADSGTPGQSASATVTINLIFQPAIDIKPGDATNTISLKRDSSIPVAILSSVNFDATTQVNVSSLRFGETGTEASLALNKKGHPLVSLKDVNGDGRLDLVVSFVTSKTGLTVADTQAVLTGNLVTGAEFESVGPVKVSSGTHSRIRGIQTAAAPSITSPASAPSSQLPTMAATVDYSRFDMLFAEGTFTSEPQKKRL